jgi:hypothetical protein
MHLPASGMQTHRRRRTGHRRVHSSRKRTGHDSPNRSCTKSDAVPDGFVTQADVSGGAFVVVDAPVETHCRRRGKVEAAKSVRLRRAVAIDKAFAALLRAGAIKSREDLPECVGAVVRAREQLGAINGSWSMPHARRASLETRGLAAQRECLGGLTEEPRIRR